MDLDILIIVVVAFEIKNTVSKMGAPIRRVLVPFSLVGKCTIKDCNVQWDVASEDHMRECVVFGIGVWTHLDIW
jgi:hypothetical protein